MDCHDSNCGWHGMLASRACSASTREHGLQASRATRKVNLDSPLVLRQSSSEGWRGPGMPGARREVATKPGACCSWRSACGVSPCHPSRGALAASPGAPGWHPEGKLGMSQRDLALTLGGRARIVALCPSRRADAVSGAKAHIAIGARSKLLGRTTDDTLPGLWFGAGSSTKKLASGRST